MASEQMVNFLVIGVQKAGTTALYEYLKQHPDVQLPDAKELHFFDDESRDWALPDYGDYHARFGGSRRRPAVGEITPIYIYWPNCLERIRAYNPQIRLVVVLRDPVERAWSHWRMERSRGVERHGFSWCIREGRARLLSAEPAGYHREFSYVERGMYGRQIERMLTIFPREQALIITSAELERNPTAAIQVVSGFLGIGTGPSLKAVRVHVGSDDGADLTATDIRYLRRIYEPDDRKLSALTGVSFS